MNKLDNGFTNTLEIEKLVDIEYKELVASLQQETCLLKSKLAVAQEILRRYKLTDVTELMKQLVIIN
jgi:hypothetical protein